MARIRAVDILNFRGIRAMSWLPSPGLNCLIGPGDVGKTSILDAIDLCLGARRNLQFTDTDFCRLDVESPICISVTVGELDDGLKNLEAYGLYLRGFNPQTGVIEDEPGTGLETVLTIRLSVGSDLEPAWSLVSKRAEAQGQARGLTWGDRVRLAPTRIGAVADYHLGWRRDSILNKISNERADAAASLAKAAREVRASFGDEAQEHLGETLGIVKATAEDLGIPVGMNVKAMLDADSVSFSGGTISLHNDDGIPLRGLGIGSTRLLIGGLQRKAAAQSTVILIDELEYGLEPHRIIRLLGSLGAKEKDPPLQAFLTTHSPVALRELSGSQLFAVRPAAARHEVLPVGTEDDVQGTIRSFPEAFLAPAVILCEGASEVGLVRGCDQHRTANGQTAIGALGIALVDGGGGDPDRPFKRAASFRSLGYRTAVIRDDDTKPTPAVEQAFLANGGTVVAWRDGRALEDELFYSLSNAAVGKLVDCAVALHGEALVNDHIKSASHNSKDLAAIRTETSGSGITLESREVLGKAARTKKAGWFKSVSSMEEVAREIVGPDLENADAGFKLLLGQIFAWSANAAS